MNLLNYKLIILGFLLVSIIFLCNILFCIFCIKFKIKIVEFSLFYYKLKKDNIENVEFILGWLPIGGYIKPLGMTSDIDEQEKFTGNELNWVFFNKEEYKKVLILFVPTIIYFIFGILLPIIYLSYKNENFFSFKYLFYLDTFFKTLFGDEQLKYTFGLLTKDIVSESNIIIFTLLIFSTLMFFWSLFDNLSNYMKLDTIKSKLKINIITIFSFLPSLLIIFLIPKLIFYYYDFSEIIIYVLNTLVGVIICGILLYFILINGVKTYNKIKSKKKSYS